MQFKERRKLMPNILKKPLKYTTAFIKHNAVLCIAAVLALITCLIVPPDAEYLGYFDFKTLTCLFCTLAVVCALKNIHFFTIIARTIVKKSGSLRTAVTTLIFITFFGSMLIANDMALLTFLPLGYYGIYLYFTEHCGKSRRYAYPFRKPAKPLFIHKIQYSYS